MLAKIIKSGKTYLLNNERKTSIGLAVILSIVGALTAKNYQNNFKIFQGAYFHFREMAPLYKPYPDEYFDFLLYGPAFSLIVAPFSQIFFHLDKVVWVLLNTSMYIYAIDKIFHKRKGFYYAWIIICFQDIYISGLSFEITSAMLGVIILSFLFIEENRVFLSGSIAGFFSTIKLFPIVSLLFYSQKPGKKFIFGFCFGLVIAIIIPAIFSSLDYTLDNYIEWIRALHLKDSLNRNLNPMIDYSLPGLFRKNLYNPNISSWLFVLFGFVILFSLFIKNYIHQNLKYELLVLGILTCFVFNSSSESPTIIIASTAVALWWNFIEKEKTALSYGFLILYMVFTALPSIDGYPKEFKDQILHAKGFRALMPVLLWFYVIFLSYFKPRKANA
jgi:hypothetical protein